MNRRRLLALLLTVPLLLVIVGPLAAQPNGPRFCSRDGRSSRQAARDFASANAAAERAGDPALLGDTLQRLGFLQYYRGDTNAALINLRRAYDLKIATGDAKGQRDTLSSIAHIYAEERVAQYDRAMEYYLQVLPQFEAAGEAEDVADTLFNIGSTYEREERSHRGARLVSPRAGGRGEARAKRGSRVREALHRRHPRQARTPRGGIARAR